MPSVDNAVNFLSDEVDDFLSTNPLPYTITPWSLVRLDLVLFFHHILYLPNIVFPLTPFGSGRRDELYPSAANIKALLLHGILIVLQVFFLLTLIPSLLLPSGLAILWCLLFLLMNKLFCLLLNGFSSTIRESKVDLSMFPKHPNEKWIFINGVAVGTHWMQSNLDRLALTFGRPVQGVHNPTSGILFDVIQCLIQRDFSYATGDVRDCYRLVKESLRNPEYNKVVFIMHSQGGIEGGMILDWLYDTLPLNLTHKLEVYTFGNAASHFNNPAVVSNSAARSSQLNTTRWKAVRHIEHYANTHDFVSRWGVLHFTGIQRENRTSIHNSFKGRVFQQKASGHQLNQHYLDTMFPLDTCGYGCKEVNAFMDSEILVAGSPEDPAAAVAAAATVNGEKGTARTATGEMRIRESLQASLTMTNGNVTEKVEEKVIVNEGDLEAKPSARERLIEDIQHGTVSKSTATTVRVRDVSRLWLYRNGQSPPADDTPGSNSATASWIEEFRGLSRSGSLIEQ